ncbi:hypothetical protein MSG28_007815 [Choristoneura fumiferana]|uniref:Uncharacterized protein n=1 Tax=Choristoneura fumiferana TaxID=7141 RepID=A0ACC0JZC4_CHOFU|nr:hypothetical protein MSG28_007815 [Choristoneura fumiferana]
MGSLNVAEWTPDQVAEWMKGLGGSVAGHAERLRARGVGGARLLALRCDQLERLGVRAIGHQELLLEAVDQLGGSGVGHAERLRARGVGGARLLALRCDQLERLGVRAIGHQELLLEAVDQLGGSGVGHAERLRARGVGGARLLALRCDQLERLGVRAIGHQELLLEAVDQLGGSGVGHAERLRARGVGGARLLALRCDQLERLGVRAIGHQELLLEAVDQLGGSGVGHAERLRARGVGGARLLALRCDQLERLGVRAIGHQELLLEAVDQLGGSGAGHAERLRARGVGGARLLALRCDQLERLGVRAIGHQELLLEAVDQLGGSGVGHAERLRARGVGGARLLALRCDQLERLGVRAIGHQELLLEAVDQLGGSGVGHAERLRARGVGGARLLALRCDQLERLGVRAIGHQELLLEAVDQLGGSGVGHAERLRARGVGGARLLALRCDQLERLGVRAIGHQELLLEAVDQLRHFVSRLVPDRRLQTQYELPRECVQQLALRVSVCAGGAARALRAQAHGDQRLETQALMDVARAVAAVKTLVCWLERMVGAAGLRGRAGALLALCLEACTCAQRDRFAEQPARAVAAAARAAAQLADHIVQDVSDPVILQPASLEQVTLAQGARPLGFAVLPSCGGYHQLAAIRFGSPAHASGAVLDGDEIVQVVISKINREGNGVEWRQQMERRQCRLQRRHGVELTLLSGAEAGGAEAGGTERRQWSGAETMERRHRSGGREATEWSGGNGVERRQRIERRQSRLQRRHGAELTLLSGSEAGGVEAGGAEAGGAEADGAEAGGAEAGGAEAVERRQRSGGSGTERTLLSGAEAVELIDGDGRLRVRNRVERAAVERACAERGASGELTLRLRRRAQRPPLQLRSRSRLEALQASRALLAAPAPAPREDASSSDSEPLSPPASPTAPPDHTRMYPPKPRALTRRRHSVSCASPTARRPPPGIEQVSDSSPLLLPVYGQVPPPGIEQVSDSSPLLLPRSSPPGIEQVSDSSPLLLPWYIVTCTSLRPGPLRPVSSRSVTPPRCCYPGTSSSPPVIEQVSDSSPLLLSWYIVTCSSPRPGPPPPCIEQVSDSSPLLLSCPRPGPRRPVSSKSVTLPAAAVLVHRDLHQSAARSSPPGIEQVSDSSPLLLPWYIVTCTSPRPGPRRPVSSKSVTPPRCCYPGTSSSPSGIEQVSDSSPLLLSWYIVTVPVGGSPSPGIEQVSDILSTAAVLFWQELAQQRWRTGGSAGGSPEPLEALYRRDKAVSCSTGLELSPRPRTCLGVALNHPLVQKLNNARLKAEEEEARDARNRGKLDKSHSTPAYDFDGGGGGGGCGDEPGPLATQTIPESPTTPTDSPTILVHSAQKADQILGFKKSSSQIQEAILQQKNRRLTDEKNEFSFAEDKDDTCDVVETINTAVTIKSPGDGRAGADVAAAAGTAGAVGGAAGAAAAPRPPPPATHPCEYGLLRAVRPDAEPEPGWPLKPRRHISKHDILVLGAERRELPPLNAAEPGPGGGLSLGAGFPGPPGAPPAHHGGVRAMFPTYKSKSLKKKNSLLASETRIEICMNSRALAASRRKPTRAPPYKFQFSSRLAERRMVAARALAGRGAGGAVWQRVRARTQQQPRWARRYLLLCDGALYAYRSAECSRADCMIQLAGFTAAAAGEVKSRPHAFKVYHTGTAFYFACESADTARAWLALIQRATHEHAAPQVTRSHTLIQRATHEHAARSAHTHEHAAPQRATHEHAAPQVTRSHTLIQRATHEHAAPQVTRSHTLIQRATHEHAAPQVTRSHALIQRATHEHAAPQVTRSHALIQRATHEHAAPQVTRSHALIQRSTHEHAAPQVTRSHALIQRATHEHAAPQVTRSHALIQRATHEHAAAPQVTRSHTLIQRATHEHARRSAPRTPPPPPQVTRSHALIQRATHEHAAPQVTRSHALIQRRHARGARRAAGDTLHTLIQRATHEHAAPQVTRSHALIQRATHEHAAPQVTRSHTLIQRATHEHARAQRATHEHAAPQVTRSHALIQRATHEHAAPQTSGEMPKQYSETDYSTDSDAESERTRDRERDREKDKEKEKDKSKFGSLKKLTHRMQSEMFNTPANKILTRKQHREWELEQRACASAQQPAEPIVEKPNLGTYSCPPAPPPKDLEQMKVKTAPKSTPFTSVEGGSVTSSKSKRSTASAIARRKQLELEAAEAKAKIHLELINKKLEADLAKVDIEDCPSEIASQAGSEVADQASINVQKWLDQGYEEPQRVLQHQPAPESGRPVEPSPQPRTDVPSDEPHDDDRLISRLATPRELPYFTGDSIEWLHFKSAYDESTSICKFSDSENLWRLRKSLRGDAKEAVTDLLIGNTPPAAVMEALELRFGRPEVIILNLTTQLKKLPALPTTYQYDLINFSIKVNNCIATIRALNQQDYLRSPELASAVLSKLPSTLIGKWTDFAYQKLAEGKPRLEILGTFLKHEAEMLSLVGMTQLRDFNKKPTDQAPATVPAKRTDENKNTCPAPVCDIDKCGLAHHRLLHWQKPTSSQSADAACDPPHEQPEPPAQPPLPADPPHERPSSTDHVMLKVVSVQISGPNGIVQTYALLDDAASVSIIDSDLATELGLKSEHSSAIKFIDAFGLEVYQSDAPTVSAQISGQHGQNSYDIKLRKVSKLNLPIQDLSVINSLNCKRLTEVKDYVCKSRVVPRLLIGEDNYFLIAPLEIIHGNKNEPYASRCNLGWSIHGYCGRTHSNAANVFHLAHSNEGIENNIIKLNELVKNYFSLDAIGVSTLRRDNSEHVRALHILDDTARLIGNQWEVGLPFREDVFIMPDSFENASSRLRSLMRKFLKDDAYADRYRNEVNKLFADGYARELKENELSAHRIWYLPHFGVQNPNKPGKLRLVFDAASKVNGTCLNDYLLTGPDLYNSLMGIMFRFRENKVVIIGDIKDMFLRIKIRPSDQHVFRFLWQESPRAPVKICVMQSLIFGGCCSPFIAQYVKNKNALKYEDLYPEAVQVIVNSHYMDDCLYSTTDATNAIKLVKEISHIHKCGGFEIRGWSSNDKQVLNNIPTTALAQSAVQFKDGSMNTTERTLGLMWHPSDDTFGFQVSFNRIPEEILNGSEPPTKAKMLSLIMSVYDIHGFLSPFIIKSKIIFQNVHRSGIDWNCRIQPDEHTKWVKWLNELKLLATLRIPRCYADSGPWTGCYADMEDVVSEPKTLRTELHTFNDASIQAYAAVSYWRFIRTDGSVKICFVASKSRVTPLRPVSVPRLELQAGLLGARLASMIQREHKDVKADKRYFWTDSSTVLQWIRSDPRSYKPYVAHRLGEIDELTVASEWRHLPSRLNAADIATREDAPPLNFQDLWFQGPDFLKEPEFKWPKDIKTSKQTDEVICEQKCVNVLSTRQITELPVPDENNSSSWIRLLMTTVRVLFFIRKCQRKNNRIDNELLKQAEELLIKKSQHDCFATEIECLKQNKPLLKNSRLLNLTPYLDSSGLLRVGGRVDKTDGVPERTKRPVILDGHHRTTRLLVEYHHRRALHGAHELVVNELRQAYWILRLRPTVRAVAAQCLFCKYRRAAPQPQRMADLPPARLQHNRRPFTFTGLDFFGPMEVTVGRGRQKRYGMLFTCLTIRAVHVEITENLTTDATIMALRRMIARRGTPTTIYSDNGTNLRGADSEIKRSIEDLNRDALCSDGAPEMGGAWERMVRSFKTALKIVLKERAPRPETLSTLMAEVEALYEDVDLSLRKQWRIAQRLTDMFWSRWLKEYLPTLLPRQKWTSERRALRIGDYVLLVEPNLERGSWRHGVVSATLPGDDGRIRVVDVRTRTGTPLILRGTDRQRWPCVGCGVRGAMMMVVCVRSESSEAVGVVGVGGATSLDRKYLRFFSRARHKEDKPAKTRWSDDIRRTAGKSWMRVADDRAQWRAIGEEYVQQWANIG